MNNQKFKRSLGFIIISSILFINSCKKEEEALVCTNLQVELAKGTSISTILETCHVKFLYGLRYEGGLLFYIDEADASGLVVSQEDLGPMKWDFNDPALIAGTTDVEIGLGKENTDKIVEVIGEGIYAAKACSDLELNGYSDWFLPSKNELDAIYQTLYLKGKGEFKDYYAEYYWTSSEEFTYDTVNTGSTAWTLLFQNGNFNWNFKHSINYVRPIRGFKF